MLDMREKGRRCPWCKDVYHHFVPHDRVPNGMVPRNGCETGLGFWVHDEQLSWVPIGGKDT